MGSASNIENSVRFPRLLEPSTYEVVERNMLHARNQKFSFVSQMATALNTQPSAFLLTANSAVPVADSIRGFYDELGVEAPLVDYILAPRKSGLFGAVIRAEKLRLSRQLQAAGENVYVVDDFVMTGSTLARAKKLLLDIGVQQVSYSNGRWYNDAKRSEINLDGVTSVHAPKMYEIGQKACELANI
jgi:adenine/guanine phosphoribosyltransferase-like PRPP-binding protein